MKEYNVAVVGATGMVGGKFLQVLEERKLPVKNYYLYASKKSAGKVINLLGKDYTVIELCEENIVDKKIDIAIFSAGGGVSRDFAPIFAKQGTIVIDNSSQWRMDENVPLVVPEVNPEALSNIPKNIVANPNCSTIQAVVALRPLQKKYGLKRVIYSTYQAVSGAGIAGYTDLVNQLKEGETTKFPHAIHGNILPHIDVFLDNGYTKEEEKMIKETKKILGDDSIKVTATTVRVPVRHGHCESINIEFNSPCTLEGINEALANQEGIIMQDDVKNNIYPMPLVAEDKDEVFVGRVRIDDTVDSGCNIWVVADNIRKGAATNTIQIAEYMIKNNLI